MRLAATIRPAPLRLTPRLSASPRASPPRPAPSRTMARWGAAQWGGMVGSPNHEAGRHDQTRAAPPHPAPLRLTPRLSASPCPVPHNGAMGRGTVGGMVGSPNHEAGRHDQTRAAPPHPAPLRLTPRLSASPCPVPHNGAMGRGTVGGMVGSPNHEAGRHDQTRAAPPHPAPLRLTPRLSASPRAVPRRPAPSRTMVRWGAAQWRHCVAHQKSRRATHSGGCKWPEWGWEWSEWRMGVARVEDGSGQGGGGWTLGLLTGPNLPGLVRGECVGDESWNCAQSGDTTPAM